jgi:hypothetical protein
MTRLTTVAIFLSALLGASSALAQLPAGSGQMPGTLPPAPPVTAPPPPAAAPPVPSGVTPLPSPSYGIPPGVTRPVIGGSSPIYRGPVVRRPRKHKRFKKRHPRTSSIPFVRLI